jgi:hypothetical protein
MPHRLPLHVQAARLPLVATDAIVQPFHDLVHHTMLMRELDRIAAAQGGRRPLRSATRVLRRPPTVN